MKTNYPALVFVILGFSLTFYIVKKVPATTEPADVAEGWTVDGDVRFVDEDRTSELSYVPIQYSPPRTAPDAAGHFEFNIPVIKPRDKENSDPPRLLINYARCQTVSIPFTTNQTPTGMGDTYEVTIDKHRVHITPPIRLGQTKAPPYVAKPDAVPLQQTR